MFYLIGLGLDKEGFSYEAYHAMQKCEKVYVDNYTVEFPYDISELEKNLEKKIIHSNREFIESGKILDEAKKINIALMVYGSPLTATTHIAIIQDAIEKKIKYKIIHAASVFDAVANTGLQLYKFGKIASIPKWEKNFESTSFLEVVKENQLIDAHTLLLIDIGLLLKEALDILEKAAEKTETILPEKIIACSHLGLEDEKIIYAPINDLKKKNLTSPFCLILPAKLHFVEQEMLVNFEEK